MAIITTELSWLEGNERDSDINNILDLPEPLTLETIQRKETPQEKFDNLGLKLKCTGNNFTNEEKDFAKAFILSGNVVYREPEFYRDCNRVPDFYIYNPLLDLGVIVEITHRNYPSPRKKKQIAELEEICRFHNIPFVFLRNKNEQEEIIKNPNSLFEM